MLQFLCNMRLHYLNNYMTFVDAVFFCIVSMTRVEVPFFCVVSMTRVEVPIFCVVSMTCVEVPFFCVVSKTCVEVPFFFVGAVDKDLLETCCLKGTQYATDSDTCEGYSTTVPGVGVGDQFSCLSILKVCCMKQKQRDQCQSGKTDAQNFGRCAIRDDMFGAEQYKVSCVHV